MPDIFISDSTDGGTHGQTLKDAVSLGYGSDISSRIELRLNNHYEVPQILADMEESFNNGFIAFLQSAFTANYFLNKAKELLGMQCSMPLGSNDFAEFHFVEDEIPIIITSGSGDTQNRTAYGLALEFWDEDTVTPENFESSFSNGVVFGKILKIKDTLNCSWWEARFIARITADRNEANREGWLHSLYNGFGKINVNAAINYSGDISVDPYLPISPSLELGAIGSISVTNTIGKINGTIGAVENATAYNIYKNDVFLMQITGLTFVDVIEYSESVVRYSYKAVRGEQLSAMSAAAAVYYPVRKIIGFLKDTDTIYGYAKAAAIYKFELLPALPLLARINLYNAVDDLINAKTKLAQEAVSVPVDDDFMNSVYRYIKENAAAYNDLDFIYEGETYSESSAQMKPKEVDAPYALTISDEIIIVNTAGAITLLDPAKVNEQIFEIVSQVDGLIPIAAENGALINGLLSITLTRFGEGIRIQAITDKYILLP